MLESKLFHSVLCRCVVYVCFLVHCMLCGVCSFMIVVDAGY